MWPSRDRDVLAVTQGLLGTQAMVSFSQSGTWSLGKYALAVIKFKVVWMKSKDIVGVRTDF